MVTGGADGIGRAVAERFARAGFAVTIVDRDVERAAEVCRTICGAGGVARAVHADLAQAAAVDGALRQLAALPPADVFVHSAGSPRPCAPPKETPMLRVYVADDCPGSPTARKRAAWLREHAPEIPLELVDVGAPRAVLPPTVFGTPTYTWHDQTIFLGNPGDQELLERVRSLYEPTTA